MIKYQTKNQKSLFKCLFTNKYIFYYLILLSDILKPVNPY